MITLRDDEIAASKVASAKGGKVGIDFEEKPHVENATLQERVKNLKAIIDALISKIKN